MNKKMSAKEREEQRKNIIKSLNTIGKKYGFEETRLTAQKWCADLHSKKKIREEITKKEKELERLKRGMA